ncbi:hypothetical protein NPIL_667511 [Nephila pilipes]|uniref:Uncharacterized protein n=1 Tax=Nephila pilipes TaxID=299642 RepID=A0A8X6NDH7_NEPPI|nr:hypothetical protein NPIL_667511 [Nephila pilipes]
MVRVSSDVLAVNQFHSPYKWSPLADGNSLQVHRTETLQSAADKRDIWKIPISNDKAIKDPSRSPSAMKPLISEDEATKRTNPAIIHVVFQIGLRMRRQFRPETTTLLDKMPP